MNDFTKEELINITEELEGTIYTELRKKIQSMIENYCEHDWDVKIYNKQPGNFKCKNCGIFLNE